MKKLKAAPALIFTLLLLLLLNAGVHFACSDDTVSLKDAAVDGTADGIVVQEDGTVDVRLDGFVDAVSSDSM